MQCHFVLCVPQSERDRAGKEGEAERERDMQQMTYLKQGKWGCGAWVD